VLSIENQGKEHRMGDIVYLILECLAEMLPTDEFVLLASGFVLVMVLIAALLRGLLCNLNTYSAA
jgi:hypothetical protein